MNDSPLTAIRVLVVDDDQDTREMLIVALEGEGAEVIAVGSVQEALSTIEQFHPNILVSDIRMPDEDGYTLIRKLRRLEAERRFSIPAIAVTAFARDQDRSDALAAGFQCHLPKPVDLSELYLTIAHLAKQATTER